MRHYLRAADMRLRRQHIIYCSCTECVSQSTYTGGESCVMWHCTCIVANKLIWHVCQHVACQTSPAEF